MRNKLNKHGPDIDIGIWFTALLRYLEAVSCLSEERATVAVTPVKSVTDREFLNTLRHKRQRRSTIVFRRTGESPSEIAINLILNNIGSITRTSLTLKVKLELMGSKTFWLNGRGVSGRKGVGSSKVQCPSGVHSLRCSKVQKSYEL